MRRNKERKLIDGLSLIANLKDELELHHEFVFYVKTLLLAGSEEELNNLLKFRDEDLGYYVEFLYRLKMENFKLKEELAKLKGGTDELQ